MFSVLFETVNMYNEFLQMVITYNLMIDIIFIYLENDQLLFLKQVGKRIMLKLCRVPLLYV